MYSHNAVIGTSWCIRSKLLFTHLPVKRKNLAVPWLEPVAAGWEAGIVTLGHATLQIWNNELRIWPSNNEPNFWEIFFRRMYKQCTQERKSESLLPWTKGGFKISRKWKMTKMSFRGLLSPEPADRNWFSLTLSLPRFLSPLLWL